MNIFLLDPDPEICATYYVDKHMKIIVEIAQVLATAYPAGIARMKHTHKQHPCAIFIRNSLSNFNYALAYGNALSKEYSFRYNRVHSCQADLNWYKENQPDIPDIGLTDPPRAFGDFKDIIKPTNCVFTDYRRYYLTKSRLFFKKNGDHCWKNREIPQFVQNYLKSGELNVE